MDQNLYCLEGAAKHQSGAFFHHSSVIRQTGNDAFTESAELAQQYKNSGGNSQICLDEGE